MKEISTEINPTDPPHQPNWTTEDQVRLLTCLTICDVLAARPPRARVQTAFSLPPGHMAFVNGPARVLELRAAGDGSYVRSSGFVFGTGALGLGMLAGSLAGNAYGNSRRRRQAALDAQMMFRHQFDAAIYVTSGGFVFHNAQGVFYWDHASVYAMEVISPALALLQGQAADRQVTWQLHTPWAELTFVLWALQRHQDHRQLADGSWLQAGWLEYARRRGFDPGLDSTILTRRQGGPAGQYVQGDG